MKQNGKILDVFYSAANIKQGLISGKAKRIPFPTSFMLFI